MEKNNYMKTCERRLWSNGYKKRNCGWLYDYHQFAIGMLGYGVVLAIGSGWVVVEFYKIIEGK